MRRSHPEISKDNPHGLSIEALKLQKQWVKDGLQAQDRAMVPTWMPKVVTHAIKTGKLPKPVGELLRSSNEAFYYAVKKLGGHSGPDKWVDHVGRVGEILISEPYEEMLTSKAIVSLSRFCELFNLDYEITEKSWWNPGRTKRISIWRR